MGFLVRPVDPGVAVGEDTGGPAERLLFVTNGESSISEMLAARDGDMAGLFRLPVASGRVSVTSDPLVSRVLCCVTILLGAGLAGTGDITCFLQSPMSNEFRVK